MTVRRRVIVRGDVQGVNFRAATQIRARDLSIAGWVCNRPDGAVELVAEGDEEAVSELIAFCRQGPDHAAVADLEVVEEEPSGLDGFELR